MNQSRRPSSYIHNTITHAFYIVASAPGIPHSSLSSKPYVAVKSHGGQDASILIVQQIAIMMGCAVLPHLRNLPPWPQPLGIFSEGKYFRPRAFFETVKQIYEQVFLRLSGEIPALEQEAFIRMLLDRSTTLESGTVLFKLYEELEIDSSTPDALLTVHGGTRHLRVFDPHASPSPVCFIQYMNFPLS